MMTKVHEPIAHGQVSAPALPEPAKAGNHQTWSLDIGAKEPLSSTQDLPSQLGDGDDIVVIAVMGATGVGKSCFIKTVTERDDVKIGDTLTSETTEICAYEFVHQDKLYVLVDTPGFDDTNRPDTEITNSILQWLKESMLSGQHLNGIIYLHRIIDTRMGGTALRNNRIFSKLVGNNAFSNVVLATTFWEEVPYEIATKREHELTTNDNLWGGMLRKGATIARLKQHRNSGLQILEKISRHRKMVLQAQDEMVNQGKSFSETTAIQELGVPKPTTSSEIDEQSGDEQKNSATDVEENHRFQMLLLEQRYETLQRQMMEKADRAKAEQLDLSFKQAAAEEQHRPRLKELERTGLRQTVKQILDSEDVMETIQQGAGHLVRRFMSLTSKFDSQPSEAEWIPQGPCNVCGNDLRRHMYYYHCRLCSRLFHCESCGRDCGERDHPYMDMYPSSSSNS